VLNYQLIQGDVREALKTLPSNSVNTCVTSPPYFGLRDYGTAEWDGGNPECDHELARVKTRFDYKLNYKQQSNRGSDVKKYSHLCPCGAQRIDVQIGLEQTPEDYIKNLVEVFREVRRVLRDDGTLWLNLGDSYNAGRNGGHAGGKASFQNVDKRYVQRSGLNVKGLKPKDLCMIPARVALALQADGWYLRSDVIWHKPNAMPESTKDRPARDHEYIFLLSKSPKYYYDNVAVEVPVAESSIGRAKRDRASTNKFLSSDELAQGLNYARANDQDRPVKMTRNRRTVWSIPTKHFKGAHFATFPTQLIEPCVMAGCPEGGVVLDPFSGSGTTGIVSLNLNRNYTGIELNPEYIGLARERAIAEIKEPFLYYETDVKEERLAA
jgi:DNA modification methylase